MSIILALSCCLVMYLSHLTKDALGLQIIFSSSPTRRNKNRRMDDPKQPKDPESTVVLLFNKPEKVLTSHVSVDDRPTVYDEIYSMEGFVPATKPISNKTVSFQQATDIVSKLHAVGRLDADTTGLLLLTNDGGLVHHVTNANAATHAKDVAITKTYQALIMGDHNEESLKSFWEGVDIGAKYGGMTRPVIDLRILDHPNRKSTVVSLTISEGKNRQVRRMFHAIGSGVMKLKRTNVGNHLTIDGLDVGQWRILSDDEVCRHLKWEPRILEESYSTRSFEKRKIKASPRHRSVGQSEVKKPGRTRRRRKSKNSSNAAVVKMSQSRRE